MNKREIISEGLLRGYSVAKNIDLVDIGDYIDGYHIDEYGRVKVTTQNWFDVHLSLANSSEENDRSFSPFEFLAHDLNVLSDKKRYDVWAVFNESIFKGQIKALKERWKSIRMTKKDYEKSFSGSSDLFNVCWRKFLSFQSATGEPDINEIIEVEILLGQFASELVNDSSSRFYIYG
jgi:hypothetical protein